MRDSEHVLLESKNSALVPLLGSSDTFAVNGQEEKRIVLMLALVWEFEDIIIIVGQSFDNHSEN